MDVYTDNRVLKSALENGGCRSSEVNGVLKDIFRSCREYNFSLDVCYVPSGENPADLPPADRIQIVCCQIALGSKSNTFSGPTRSISCPWIVTANVFAPFVLIAPLRKYFLEQDFHGAFTIVVPDLKPRRF